MAEKLIEGIAQALRNNWDGALLENFQGRSYTCREVAQQMAKLHIIYKAAGVGVGDKIAICAKNSAEWAIGFFATLSYGAVAVPLLHEFHPDTIVHLVNHSEAKLLLTEPSIANAIKDGKTQECRAMINVEDLTLLSCSEKKIDVAVAEIDRLMAEVYPGGIKKDSIKYASREEDDIALINYTSGSMGFSKGVMLTYSNLWNNAEYAIHNIPFLHIGDSMLSMLPLAHMYGLLFELVFPFLKSCHITFLGRVPSPKVVLAAFNAVKPQLVITVPLVIEKIMRTRVFPALQKGLAAKLIKVPGLRSIVYAKVRRQLIDAFGGKLQELVIGGAALSSDVEDFLRRIRFPFTVGYGMTECAPLITYEVWNKQRPRSCGRIVDNMEARIDSPDPENVPGELWVRGAHVMKGYYKNPEATKPVLKDDGWMNTGDMCTMDRDGFIYIRGRNKCMILGPSGQNIYPEEIEVVLNAMPLVAESIVVDRGGNLVALVYPDQDTIRREGLSPAQVDDQMKANLKVLNASLPAYSKVREIELQPKEFEKTPKHSIKRYLYK